MAEHKEYWETGDEQGCIKISEDVIASIASIAATDTDGISGMHSSSLKGDLANILGKSKKTVSTKGVRVTLGDKDDVTLDLSLTIRFGVSVAETARTVQDNVKNSVESMTGLKVVAVNVCVGAVTFDEPAAAAAEEPEAVTVAAEEK